MQLERMASDDWLGGIEFRIVFDYHDLVETDHPLPTMEEMASISDNLREILLTVIDIEEKRVKLGIALQGLNSEGTDDAAPR